VRTPNVLFGSTRDTIFLSIRSPSFGHGLLFIPIEFSEFT